MPGLGELRAEMGKIAAVALMRVALFTVRAR